MNYVQPAPILVNPEPATNLSSENLEEAEQSLNTTEILHGPQPSPKLYIHCPEATAPVRCCEKDWLTGRAASGGPSDMRKLSITGETHLGILKLNSLHNKEFGARK
ncbi:hypothetical protein llap_6594 [Limosa lapponica baueri]|uniref:Uncharacterized protein n=1 Tax=Limosa lapponica baueri TaxID=1758121 RepID=A0A2I0UAS8_LIMLA|nr:hypothetical protein llap_6594 [Limosa lapponica baueri]